MRHPPFMAGASLALVLAFALGLARAGQPARVGDLIEQLGGDSFVEREEARKALEAIGPSALAALRQAAKRGNLEMARRAAALIRSIEDSRLTATLLAPTKVRLKVDNLPVLDAVAQLSEASGYALRVDGDRTGLAGKTVTLDTGVVPFWAALDRLGAQAGLVEKQTFAALPGDATVVQPNAPLPLEGGAMPVKLLRGPPPLRMVKLPATAVTPKEGPKKTDQPAVPAPLPGLVILAPGTAADQQVHYAGAVRVVLRPAPPAKQNVKPVGPYHDFVLDASAEPRLLGFTVSGVPTITRAIDEHGAALAFVLDPGPALVARPGIGAELSFDDRGNMLAPPRAPVWRGVTVRLQPGQRRARQLRELAGTLPAQVLLPGTELAAFDNVGKAVGKAVDVKGGGRLQLDRLDKLATAPGLPLGEAAYTVILKLDGVPNLDSAFTYVAAGDRVVALNRGTGLTVALFDADAERLALVAGPAMQQEVHPDTQAIKHVVTAQFRRAKGQGAPARLVLTGTHVTTIAVPFRFTNVPLP